MSWDGEKANHYFIHRYSINPYWTKYKPDNEFFRRMHDIDLAIIDLYHTCARNSWKKENLFNGLKYIVEGKQTTAPSKAHYPEVYVETYNEEAKQILDDLESGNLNFEV